MGGNRRNEKAKKMLGMGFYLDFRAFYLGLKMSKLPSQSLIYFTLALSYYSSTNALNSNTNKGKFGSPELNEDWTEWSLALK